MKHLIYISIILLTSCVTPKEEEYSKYYYELSPKQIKVLQELEYLKSKDSIK